MFQTTEVQEHLPDSGAGRLSSLAFGFRGLASFLATVPNMPAGGPAVEIRL
jgi:hypothetical protein